MSHGTYVNKHGHTEQIDHLKPSDWSIRWEKGWTQWHKEEVNPVLQHYCRKLHSVPNAHASETQHARRPSILVPLCGKSIDMIYLHRLGYTVVGVELVPLAIEQFFAEQIEYLGSPKKTTSHGLTVWSNADDTLVIIEADIFSPSLTPAVFPHAHPCDSVWDRGSLIAINPHTRQQYVHKITHLLDEKRGDWLLSLFEYDTSLMHGPPFSLTTDQLHQLFPSKNFNVEFVCESGNVMNNGADKPPVEGVVRSWFIQPVGHHGHHH